MPAAIRSWSSGFAPNGGDDGTVPRPSGAVDGDRIIAMMWTDNDNVTLAPTDTGWSLSPVATGTNPLIQSNRGNAYVWERATAGPTNYAFDIASYADWGGYIFCIQDLDPSAEVVVKFATGGSSASHVAPSILNTEYDGEDPILICGFYSLNQSNNNNWTSMPSGMTPYTQLPTAFQWIRLGAASLQLSGTPNTNTRTATLSTSRQWMATSIVIPNVTPAPPTGPEPGRFLIAY